MDKTQKNKKALLDIDYDTVKEEKDFAKYFKPSKSLTLTKSTLTKYSKEKNTLPKDLHYDADKLFRLFCKSQVMVSCKGYVWFLCLLSKLSQLVYLFLSSVEEGIDVFVLKIKKKKWKG